MQSAPVLLGCSLTRGASAVEHRAWPTPQTPASVAAGRCTWGAAPPNAALGAGTLEMWLAGPQHVPRSDSWKPLLLHGCVDSGAGLESWLSVLYLRLDTRPHTCASAPWYWTGQDAVLYLLIFFEKVFFLYKHKITTKRQCW